MLFSQENGLKVPFTLAPFVGGASGTFGGRGLLFYFSFVFLSLVFLLYALVLFHFSSLNSTQQVLSTQ